MTRARLGPASLIACGAILLAGCITDGAAIVTETPTSKVIASPSAEPSGSATPSAEAAAELSNEELLALLPEGATNDDMTGAAFTAVFWLEEFGNAISSGDPRVISQLGTSDCGYCDVQASSISDSFVDGKSLAGGEVSVDGTTLQSTKGDDGFTYVSLSATLADIQEIDATGGILDVTPGGTAVWTFQMTRLGTAWRVNGVQISEP